MHSIQPVLTLPAWTVSGGSAISYIDSGALWGVEPEGSCTVSLHLTLFNVRAAFTCIIKNTLKCNNNCKEKPHTRAQCAYRTVELVWWRLGQEAAGFALPPLGFWGHLDSDTPLLTLTVGEYKPQREGGDLFKVTLQMGARGRARNQASQPYHFLPLAFPPSLGTPCFWPRPMPGQLPSRA